MPCYVNIHTHSCDKEAAHQLISLDVSTWEAVVKNTPSDALFSVGIHPYHSAEGGLASQLANLEKAMQHPKVAALGELGLDRSIDIPMAVQQNVFEQQLQLAVRYAKPLVIHAVRSVPNVLYLLKENRFEQPFIFHGFTGKPEMVEQIYRHGGHLSFGPLLLSYRAWDEALRLAYKYRILLLETDTKPTSISAVYARVADVLGVPINDLSVVVDATFTRLFSPAQHP